MMIRLIKEGDPPKSESIKAPLDIYKAMRFLEKEEREKLYALHLDAKNRILAMELLSVGSLTNSVVHAREVFKGAILNNSVSIILVHNHPSGDTIPSEEDKLITNILFTIGDLMQIPVRDHVIIGHKGFYSFKFSNNPVNELKKKEVRKNGKNKGGKVMENKKEITSDDRRNHFNRALEILALKSEELKEEDTLRKKEINALSKILREATCNMFVFIGVNPKHVKDCYRMHVEYIKNTPKEKRIGYLP